MLVSTAKFPESRIRLKNECQIDKVIRLHSHIVLELFDFVNQIAKVQIASSPPLSTQLLYHN